MAERTPDNKVKVVEHWLPTMNKIMDEYIQWKKKQVSDRIMAAKVHNDVEHAASTIVKELDDAMQFQLVLNQVFDKNFTLKL
jgi:hypothetical protein